MALFLKVLTLTPCFSKCKFLRSETVLEFYARHVHCTKSDSLCKSIHFAPFILTSHTHIILKSILLCKKLICITENTLSWLKIKESAKKKISWKLFWRVKLCTRLHRDLGLLSNKFEFVEKSLRTRLLLYAWYPSS